MTVLHGFFTFQDATLPTGSRLFAGSLIKAWVQRATIGGQNATDVSFRPNQELELIKTTVLDDKTNIGSNWNRRKAHVQQTGAENLQITMNGGWEVTQVGSAPTDFGPGSVVHLSPYVLMRMALSGHTFYVRGGTAMQSIINGQVNDINGITGSQVGSFYPTGSGIPIQIATWHLEDVAELQDYTTWEMALIEDKDSLFFSN